MEYRPTDEEAVVPTDETMIDDMALESEEETAEEASETEE